MVGNNDILTLSIRGEKLKFPFIWLRDNCQCEQCFHTSAKSRILDWRTFNLNVLPLEIKQNEKSLEIDWDDGHTSHYDFDWLKFRSFKPEDKKNYTDNFYKPAKITWNGENFKDVFSRHDFNEILTSDQALHDWLFNLSVYGVALIENTPQKEDACEDIANKIGFIRKTHYGKIWVVQHVPNTSNVAYLSSNLEMHADLPYYEHCTVVNILHCLVQTSSEGGENLLADGHYIAKYMKEHHPKEYHLLTNIEVEWSDVGVEHGNEFYKLFRSPVIRLNKRGEVIRILFSIPQRSSHFIGDIEDVKPWYKAYAMFLDLSHKFAGSFKTQAGQTLVFDNSRLLHCRSAYNDTSDNVRKIIGSYVDWDEIYSRLRCLKLKLKGTTATN